MSFEYTSSSVFSLPVGAGWFLLWGHPGKAAVNDPPHGVLVGTQTSVLLGVELLTAVHMLFLALADITK